METTDNERILDCRGLPCPQPVIQTKDTLAMLRPGDVLLVIVDNEASRDNIRRFAESQQHTVQVAPRGGEFHLRIGKSGAAAGPEPQIVCDVAPRLGIVIYIAAETLGRGDEELGRALMTVYIDTLSHFVREISHIILVNAGVKLAVEGSPVLEHLQELAQSGIEVLACGACLKHFKLQDRLGVGSVSNMFTILETLSRAPKVMSP